MTQTELEKRASLGAFNRLGKNVWRKTIGRTMSQAAKKAPKGTGRSTKELLKPVFTLLGVGAALGVAGAAEGAIVSGVNRSMKDKHFNKAINFDPEVQRWNRSDPQGVKARFNTLYTFNTDAAKDPLVASSWIKQTMEIPAVTPRTIIEATPKDKKTTGKATSIVMRTLGGEKAMQQTVPTILGAANVPGFEGKSDR
jgi:hypothetical protein